MPSSAMRTPASNPASDAPFAYSAISAFRSRSLAGRLKACEARRETISRAHTTCCGAVSGWHVKILRRLGVGDTPVIVNGPVMARSRRCGSVVNP